MTARRKYRYQSLFFDHKSTQRTDYQLLPLTPPTPTLYQHKSHKLRPPYPGLKNQHTFDVYDGLIPFSLLHKPKDIVRTNPLDCQQKFVSNNQASRKKEGYKLRGPWIFGKGARIRRYALAAR
ncbi:hypothetical protein EVAR_80887_1 [Eumeta japonica]|uniref:Uncharacterized protein n=1 Tax=Eumeta variegata TaxID=151549 RepID=A0A4C1V063_EUMVA|nr:hypothetical protein EVAR_80887_1 [Eumeta japonica]